MTYLHQTSAKLARIQVLRHQEVTKCTRNFNLARLFDQNIHIGSRLASCELVSIKRRTATIRTAINGSLQMNKLAVSFVCAQFIIGDFLLFTCRCRGSRDQCNPFIVNDSTAGRVASFSHRASRFAGE
jgi:hypothetical protein